MYDYGDLEVLSSEFEALSSTVMTVESISGRTLSSSFLKAFSPWRPVDRRMYELDLGICKDEPTDISVSLAASVSLDVLAFEDKKGSALFDIGIKLSGRLQAVWRVELRVIGQSFHISYKIHADERELFKGSLGGTDLVEVCGLMVDEVFCSSSSDLRDGVRELLSGEKSGNVSVVAKAGFWKGLVAFFDLAFQILMWTGVAYLAYNLFDDGWSITHGTLVKSFIMMITGSVGSLTLTPILEAVFINKQSHI